MFKITVAALGALQTFLGAGDNSAKHKSSGNEYFTLKNQVRLFREIEINQLSETESIEHIKEFSTRRDELNTLSPNIPYPTFWLARGSIDAGYAKYRTDKEKK